MRVKSLEKNLSFCRWNTVLRCGSSRDYQERPFLSSRVHQNWQKTEPGPRGVRWASEVARAPIHWSTTLHYTSAPPKVLRPPLSTPAAVSADWHVNYWQRLHRWTVSFYAGRTTRGIFRFLFLTQFLYFVEIFWLISKELVLSRV